jgi:hypothetical protein
MIAAFSVCALSGGSISAEAAEAKVKKPVAKVSQTATSGPLQGAPAANSSEAAVKRALASVGPGGAAAGGGKNDPNHAVEIRGQSRTLSMMLVLKNGKENINFIKIRKDYSPEIAGTQY